MFKQKKKEREEEGACTYNELDFFVYALYRLICTIIVKFIPFLKKL
jgi:hypothetical protein